MTNKETIDRWAEQIVPVVFRAEDALQKAKPEWKERLPMGTGTVASANGHATYLSPWQRATAKVIK